MIKPNKNSIIKNPSYQVIEYNEKYFNDVVKLFIDSYRKNKSLRYFKYNIQNTPYGKPIRFLMKYKDEIVGSHSIRPVMLKINKNEVIGGLTYFTMTHPNHRGKGIFLILASMTHKEAKKRNYNFIMGFSNQNSIHGYKKGLHHKELKPINYVQLKKNHFNVKIPKIRNNWFPKNLEELFLNSIEKNDFSIQGLRDNKFFNWRYKKNPEFQYLTCYEPDKFFFIFKKYNNALHIIDFIVTDKEFLKTLVATSFVIAKKFSCNEISLWIAKRHPLFTIIEKNSYFNLKQQQFLHVLGLNKKYQNQLLELNNWHYTMGDSDVF